jgi:glyoxylase-like metal-dependent hydrolase (beta-lactamase superfamily II)
MQRERVAENVYYFQSDVYAQVTAGAIIGPNWAVIIDTLAIPEETIQIRDFIEQELNLPIRYVINTHYHADHAWGNCFFPGATVIAHALSRKQLATRGQQSLIEARKQNPTFRKVKIILPQLTFEESYLILRVGKKTLSMFPLPGPCSDNIGVLVEEDRVLFAGDAFMALPYIVDGNIDDTIASLKKISKMGLENVVPGHGDIVLRGEIEGMVRENLAYLSALRKAVRKASRRKYPQEILLEIGVEDCGKSRVLIGGLAEELHKRNLRALYFQMYGQTPKVNPNEVENYAIDDEVK